jgi:magnesium chelatase subunit I
MEAERKRFDNAPYRVTVPTFMKEIVAELTDSARRSPEINQRSGVSVRMSISNYETLISNALRRAIVLNENDVVPRVSDLPYLFASTTGKIELESIEEGREKAIVDDLIKKAVRKVFNRSLKVDTFRKFIERFKGGSAIEVSDMMVAQEYSRIVGEHGELMDGVIALGSFDNATAVASAVEFILEGLHLNDKLNKETLEGRRSYRV